MNLVSTQYTLLTKSLELVHSGCDLACGTECHSKELADFNLGTDWETWIDKIATKVHEFDDMIDWIWVYGGEPLLQDPKALIKMLAWLTSFKKPLVLFTRFNINEVPIHVKILVDYIKTGKYIHDLKDDRCKNGHHKFYGIELATTNQKVWKKVGDIWV